MNDLIQVESNKVSGRPTDANVSDANRESNRRRTVELSFSLVGYLVYLFVYSVSFLVLFMIYLWSVNFIGFWVTMGIGLLSGSILISLLGIRIKRLSCEELNGQMMVRYFFKAMLMAVLLAIVSGPVFFDGYFGVFFLIYWSAILFKVVFLTYVFMQLRVIFVGQKLSRNDETYGDYRLFWQVMTPAFLASLSLFVPRIWELLFNYAFFL